MDFGVVDVRNLIWMSKYLILMLPTNRSSTPRPVYRCHENTKKCTYEVRIHEVEHGIFTPLVFSAIGGMADQATVFYISLASLLLEKRSEHYAVVMG